jgi:hypothetical protein
MIARVVVFEDIDVSAARTTIDEATEIIRPLVEGLPGYRGVLELATEDGKFLSMTLFDSMENAQAAEPTYDGEMPAKLGHIFRRWAGRRTAVDHYEVVGEDRR